MFLYVVLYLLPLALGLSLAIYLPLWISKRGRLPPMQHAARILLLCTAMLILYITILWYGKVQFVEAKYRFLNLVPFAWIWEPYEMGLQRTTEQLFINVVMFLPLGILLSTVFPALGKFYRTALVCLGCTLAIETVQYFTGRSADIDDVLCNLSGGMAGYPFYQFLRKNRVLKPLFFAS